MQPVLGSWDVWLCEGGDVRRLRLEESWRPVAVAGGEDVKNVLTFEVYVLGPNIYCCESHTESHIEAI